GGGQHLRARSKGAPPRHQAIEPSSGPGWHSLGHGLRTRKRGGRESDADRGSRRHAQLHGTRAIRGEIGGAERHLWPWTDALRPAYGGRGLPQFRSSAVDRRNRAWGAGSAETDCSTGAARFGDDCAKVDGQGTRAALSVGGGTGRRIGTLSRRSAD